MTRHQVSYFSDSQCIQSLHVSRVAMSDRHTDADHSLMWPSAIYGRPTMYIALMTTYLYSRAHTLLPVRLLRAYMVIATDCR